MYDELVKELREGASNSRDLYIADAIEELQKQLREEKVDNVNLTGWLAEEHANQCPHYIRNVHDRGDDSLCDRFVCEIKALPRWIPVTERLPIVGDYILCYCKRGIGIDYGYSNFDEHAKKEGITHWMPIPPPPQEGEE